ncbi:MAG: M20/M25/M40 family metallo-hydrolase, partial [Solirubrobacteraceae bacterium]
LTGALPERTLLSLHDAGGVSAADALAGHLERVRELPRIEPPLERWRGHAEIHVAQRRALRTLGVVETVASPRRFAVQVTGEAGHSGEVTMEERHDALVAAAEIVLAVESAARAQPPQTVATVGTVEVSPGALSVIPGQARLGIDIRGTDAGSLAEIEAAIREASAGIAARRGVSAEVTLLRGGEPVSMDAMLVQAALAAAGERCIEAARTWSGAGHDAQHLSSLAPALLLFVPLHGGESHTPDEGAEMDEIVQAAEVAAAVLSAVALDSRSLV